MNEIPLPRTDQRFTIIGPEGSGKSVVARELLTNYPTFIVVDVKRDWSWGSFGKADPRRFRYAASSVDGVRKILNEIRRNGTVEHVVYRPPWKDVSSGEIDKIAFLALERRNTGLYYDETEAVIRPDWQTKCALLEQTVMQGRALHVPVWFGTKRPTRVPLNFLASANARIIFNLRLAQDRARVEEICGGESIPWDSLRKNKHSWIYSDDEQMIGPMTAQTEDF